MLSVTTRTATTRGPARDRPDVFLSYAREDRGFAEGRLAASLAARDKDVWVDVQDIRGGASDWRANVWAAIEAATAIVFVLTPDSLASRVCAEELQRAAELNKRIIPVLRRSVDGLPIPPPLERPNWIFARAEDDFEACVATLVAALELDEVWVEQHARLAQRTGDWLRHDRDGSYLLRGSDLRVAEAWLDDAGAHREAPTAEQITYITASRRASARRQRTLLAGVLFALVVTPRSPSWMPPVVTYSALTGDGIAELWSQALAHRQQLTSVGEFAARRREQHSRSLPSRAPRRRP